MTMHDREPAILKRLLDHLHEVRSRRDAEPRFSDAWRAADTEMHDIERTIFRSPWDMASEAERISTAEPQSLGLRRASPSTGRDYARNRAG